MKKTAIIVLLVLMLGPNLSYAQNLIVQGSLGVGTSNPAFPLDVSGNARVNTLGIWGNTPSSGYGIFGAESILNPSSTLSGIFTILYPTYSSGATQYTSAGIFETVPIVNSGATQNGYDRAILAQTLRNANGASADDSGTLLSLIGTQVTYGHYNSNGSTLPLTTNGYGLYVIPYYLTGTITNMYDIYLATPSTGGTVTNRWGVYQANTANNHFGGSVGIGTTNLGSGGSANLLLGLGAKPSSLSHEAGLYVQNVGSSAELFAFDESGNAIQISAHAQDAPDYFYDPQDGLPMIVKEVQYFLGYVRYTNKTRMARLVSMTDADKRALSSSQRVCVITETFADHEARTGEQFTLLVWDQEQAAIKQARDAERQAALNAQAALTAAIAQTTLNLASATGGQQTQLQTILADLQQQLSTLVIPGVYQIKPIPPRLQAALNSR
ncbi:MAG TPA: hypothetical protein VEF34_07120 [Syntrophobacteraceae bacterium]|nr:hypothetical protein [Syntrophobacteraceae bacterium]